MFGPEGGKNPILAILIGEFAAIRVDTTCKMVIDIRRRRSPLSGRH
jgi:hypothetical protein